MLIWMTRLCTLLIAVRDSVIDNSVRLVAKRYLKWRMAARILVTWLNRHQPDGYPLPLTPAVRKPRFPLRGFLPPQSQDIMIYVQTNHTNPIQKVFATLIGVTLIALMLTFSVAMIPFIVVTGLFGMAYFYWKTRAIRKAMSKPSFNSELIDAEACVIHDDPRITPLR